MVVICETNNYLRIKFLNIVVIRLAGICH